MASVEGGPSPAPPSTLRSRNLPIHHDRLPDLPGRDPVPQSLVNGPPTQLAHHVIPSERVGEHRAEDPPHPFPEVLQAHPAMVSQSARLRATEERWQARPATIPRSHFGPAVSDPPGKMDGMNQSPALEHFSPATRAWFTAAFAEPTTAQASAWTAIANNKNALVVAPTGSGKTLAAFLAALDRLAFGPPPTETKRRSRVVYVSPLKA